MPRLDGEASDFWSAAAIMAFIGVVLLIFSGPA